MSELSSPAASFNRARDLPRLEQVAQDLNEVEAALRRLDNDSYGRCLVCGEEISDSQLERSPTRQDCGVHGT